MEHIKHVKHGESKTRLYRIWSNLKNRVLPNSVKSKYYFDRGIGLCDEWKNSFISFRDWSINNGYDDKLTLDRIDNDGSYTPENCRWVDMKTQANNRSNNITVYADKECVPFSDVCRILGVDYNTAYGKIIKHLVANKNVERIIKNWKEPVSEKKCMFTKDNYTDEDRKVLCEDCKERCTYAIAGAISTNAQIKKEPVSKIDFEQELYKAFGQIKDFTLGVAIAKRFYDIGRKHNEPVSEELEEAIEQSFIFHDNQGDDFRNDEQIETAYRYGFKTGAKWKEQQFEKNRLKHCNSITNEQAELEQGFIDQHLDKYQRMPTFLDAIEYGMRLQQEQMMANATDVTVHIDAGGYPYIPQIELYDYCEDIPLAKEGDKYKVVLIKED